MHAESIFSYAALLGFLFTLARVSCVFAFLPLTAFRATSEPATASAADRYVAKNARILGLFPEPMKQLNITFIAALNDYFPMQYKCFAPRMKICPSASAGEA